jgi:AcrR family transcriptional regulator
MTVTDERQPASRRFSRADVVDVGVDITGAHGLDALTLSAVADRLGVRRPSLYHHVPGGVQELRTAVVARISARVRQSIDETPAEQSVWGGMAHQLRMLGQISRDYPGVVQYILTSGRDEPVSLDGANEFVRLLLGSELRDTAPEAYLIIHAYVTGWAHARRPSAAAARARGLDPLATALDDGERLDTEHVLFTGLRAVLLGLAASQPAPEPEIGTLPLT